MSDNTKETELAVTVINREKYSITKSVENIEEKNSS
jgi:hypothetical protein